jgi:molybdopterin molybdotransferase
MPAGADAVVMQEDVTRSADRATFAATPRPGQFIRKRGLDFSDGVMALPAGTLIEPRKLGLAAAMNHATVAVHRRPRVAILSTGDELVEPGTEPGPGQIVSSNAGVLAAVVRREGAEATVLGIVPDRLDATLAAVRRARAEGYDVLITSGGASVGEHDLMREVLRAEGVEPAFWKIAMRPGKPLMMADLGGMRLLGLPGNPVASFVCAMLFLTPLLRRLAGRTDILPDEEDAVLGAALAANDLRQDYLRATLAERDGLVVATPLPVQDSSMIRVLAESDALVIRAPHAPAVPEGAPCRIIRLAR